MGDEIQALSTFQHMRRRPAMYIGNTNGPIKVLALMQARGFAKMLKGWEGRITLQIRSDKCYTILLESERPLRKMFQAMYTEFPNNWKYFDYLILNPFSSSLEIFYDEVNGSLAIDVELDATLFGDMDFDYLQLSDGLRQLAWLNKNLTIRVKDQRKEWSSGNHFHFPKGIHNMHESICRQRLYSNLPDFKVTYEGSIGEIEYDVILCFTEYWRKCPDSFFYGKHERLLDGSSLEYGIREGFRTALKQYFNPLEFWELNRCESLWNNLHIIAHIKTENMYYKGSTKDGISDERVEEAMIRKMSELCLKALKADAQPFYRLLLHDEGWKDN